MFNESYYLQMNPDVAEAVANGQMSAQEHFELYGKFENRSPSPFFDPVLYLNSNADVAEAVKGGLFNAFDHFMAFGQNEDRSASHFFNPAVYLAENPDVRAAVEAGMFTSPFEHFLLHGQNELRNTSPFFDLKGYLDANPDVADAVRDGHTTAFDHFINHGFAEGRDLGNGISLAQFANDPEAMAAIQGGNISALMERVAEVAPFLPTFELSAGYTIPSNQPIPQDFVPVEGEHLVIPEGVEVPPGTDLPPAFEPDNPEPGPGPGPDPDPVDTPTSTYGSIAATDGGKLWAGSGNSAANFNVTTTSLTQVELALKGYIRGTGDVGGDDADGSYEFARGDKTGFAFSVASLGERSVEDLIKEGYSFHLKIDNDSGEGFGAKSHEFVLTPQVSATPDKEKAQDSGFNWVLKGQALDAETGNIVDDEGNKSVTQNIQTPLWYGALEQPGSSGALLPGSYSVSLEMRKGEQSIATEEITLEVNPGVVVDTSQDALDAIATVDGQMFAGSGNPINNFNVVRIDAFGDSASDIEIALGGQQRNGPQIYTPGDDGVIAVPGHQTPVFKFSVASLGEGISLEDLLKTYDIKLYVDTDKGSETNFIELKAVANSAGSSGALDWEFIDEKYSGYKLVDDEGGSNVSQNIQALAWYMPGADDGLFKGAGEFGPGEYTVRLEVLEKGTVNIVGSNKVIFEVEPNLG